MLVSYVVIIRIQLYIQYAYVSMHLAISHDGRISRCQYIRLCIMCDEKFTLIPFLILEIYLILTYTNYKTLHGT